MKKLFLAAAAILFAAVAANAQIGVVGGITSSKTNLKDAYADAANISQYHVGLTFKANSSDYVAIQPSIIYNMKGATISDIQGISIPEDIEYKTGYLEIPVQCQVGVPVGDSFRVYGFCEPFIGYALSNKIEYGDTVKDTWDNLKSRFEYGVSLGAGVEILNHLQVSLKYFWNLGNVYGDAGEANDITVSAIAKAVGETPCNGIAVSVGFLF